jgi:thioredoxin reductase (NADPH)
MDDFGYLKVRPRSTYMSVEGVFAAENQAATAAGTECMAAIDAERRLEARKAG